MTLAIKFGDITDETSISGAIYFDAVTDFSKNYSGKVTEHPIESGVSVSDHFISHNPKFSISGVISGVDFSPFPWGLLLDGDPVLNRYQQAEAVSIKGVGGKLRQFLPGVVTQFLPQIDPEVEMDEEERFEFNSQIETALTELMNGIFYDEKRKKWVNRMTPISLYNVYNGVPVLDKDNLILTKLSLQETVETGEALEFKIDLEQVRFVSLQEAEAPKPQKKTSTERATTPTKDMGTATTSSPAATPTSERVTTTGSLETATN